MIGFQSIMDGLTPIRRRRIGSSNSLGISSMCTSMPTSESCHDRHVEQEVAPSATAADESQNLFSSFAHMGRFGSRDEIHTRINNTPAAVSVSKV
jgi:hypothetical protein